ncbi:hypothetical protein PHYPSEUDO_009333 [Phytophthora pseudosyringae]|uniref:Uncharacterized protein n=1 Tax=Phytophthora pseudosyringae TaxID=221518 RepID=A0A8T1VCW2_9STRA|nr:hypothetical protein PHYPSEUDO_009333 [Phytophthora pseudosyringae]
MLILSSRTSCPSLSVARATATACASLRLGAQKAPDARYGFGAHSAELDTAFEDYAAVFRVVFGSPQELEDPLRFFVADMHSSAPLRSSSAGTGSLHYHHDDRRATT